MRWFLLASALALSAHALAQPAATENVQIRVERVAPGVAVLFGRGGNIGLSYGADGNVLIDDQYAPLTERILSAVRSIDPDPVRFVINTHWHGDHTGGNENIGRAGAIIVAHDNVRRRMSMEQVVRGEAVPPSPAGALPVVTFDRSVAFHLNGDTIRAVHVAHAHTDGDAFIWWTRANVLHMGDVYFNGMLPFIDLDSGGSIGGLISAVDIALSMTSNETVYIPGHGPIARRADVQAYRDMLWAVTRQVRSAKESGCTLDEVKAMRIADRFGRDTDFISPDAFVEAVYRSLLPRSIDPASPSVCSVS